MATEDAADSHVTLPINRKTSVVGFVLNSGIYIVLLGLCAVVSVASPYFLTAENMSNVLRQSSEIGIVAVGMTYVLIVRGIDVSVGATVALSSAAGTVLIAQHGFAWFAGVMVMLLVGLTVGIVNGYSTAYLGMPAFLVTLATLTVARGLSLTISGGRSIFELPTIFTDLGAAKLGPVPVPVVFWAVVLIVGQLVLSKTLLGRWVYAVGGNPEAARVSGIPVRSVVLISFAIAGFCAGLAGFLLTARLASFTTSMGVGYEFTAIAAVVIGGTSLFGGKGNLGGTLIGVLILGVINNALNLLSVSPFYQDVVRGLIIFVAVLLDSLRNKYAERYLPAFKD